MGVMGKAYRCLAPDLPGYGRSTLLPNDELLKLTQRVPTCVIWGDRDPYVSPTWADRFGAQTVHHLSDISHWPPVEAPQEVAQKLMAFFA